MTKAEVNRAREILRELEKLGDRVARIEADMAGLGGQVRTSLESLDERLAHLEAR